MNTCDFNVLNTFHFTLQTKDEMLCPDAPFAKSSLVFKSPFYDLYKARQDYVRATKHLNSMKTSNLRDDMPLDNIKLWSNQSR